MQPLAGVRVLDLTRLLPGPFATLVLADLGATVDKVEDPGSSDYLRLMPPQVRGQSAAFGTLHRGKRSMVLDLKHPDGPAVLLDLICAYDVLIEQFRPGVLARLGVGHDVLLAKNPSLVVCALTGYGQTGPMAGQAGHDINYAAHGGLLGLTGPASGPPQVPGFQVADISGGLWSVLAILAGLTERAKTGRGRVLDIAMSESALPFGSVALASAIAGGAPRRGDEVLTGGIAPYNTYAAEDGALLSLGALEPKFWATFCSGTGIPFDPSAFLPGPHQAELKRRVADVFRTKTGAAWRAFASEHDCCLQPILAPDELRDDPHHKARGTFFDIDTDEGASPQIATPLTPRDKAFTPAPRAGEHTDAILAEAGLSGDAIAALRARGVVS